ncbi:MAG: hypothetical protein COU11_00260 [Candidatus Harrisonbacteria bacterium CG10_big_fil_rev_8_21_14_0_10_49_15]|uniref:Uncharacterized protein n=1 Tax=Candidatus Harrisonbacteria bacterium CG10_big_fil_rev_8_21_14_0_10_49_15 TaxID=1974587 RepID=A0A2H0ULZ1_9BACT|nr:MAG: hypothetical protein COU11_00260 [Candidatus Harrisonbacteria bacterium CG10_big_fil_rev_8_21_14_0_10_49_15]
MEKIPSSEQVNSPEEKPEKIPSEQEVADLFKELLGGCEYKEVRKREDERGLYLWEISVPDGGGVAEYVYRRKGNFKEVKSASTGVHVVYYDEDGIPCGGDSVAEYGDGRWEKV